MAAILLACLVIPARLLAHDLLLSTIDLIARAGTHDPVDVIVTIPLSQLAKAEHAPTGAMTSIDADVAIRHRLHLQSQGREVTLGESMVLIDPSTDTVRWQASVAAHVADVTIGARLLTDVGSAYTRVRTIDHDGATQERWLGASAVAPRPTSTETPAGRWSTLVTFVRMGFAHVMDGPDHIAFVVGLLLLGGTLRSVLVTITSFTLAHSLTLGLAATGLWVPSPRVIEPLIALSIVAIAIENLWRRRSVGRRPYYALVFGLVHGFGLAGPLHDLGESGASLGAALLPFNVGVEIAQAAIVLAVWPVLRWLSQHQPRQLARVAFVSACAIGMMGAYWFADRVVPGGLFPPTLAQGTSTSDAVAGRIDATFRPFASTVKTRHDDQFFYVESNGMPDHRMMVGITAWQQQVPLPQAYRGNNAWRFPLVAKPAAAPLSAKDHFFRGAIAIAANGVPIFNPIKNDGRTDTFLAGELDEFGGHGGRADDYHYHLAPLHLQKLMGTALPVAYALDGYAIYGLNEPDGTAPGRLDAFNGHTMPDGTYHYHSTRTYPYLNGGFHGEVVERDGQVDPQPNARPVRPSTEPLRGATVTGFETLAANEHRLTYSLRGETWRIHYRILDNGTYVFDYIDPRGATRTETYSGRGRGRGGR